MRTMSRLIVTLCIVFLAVGPLLAAPVYRPGGPTIGAPAAAHSLPAQVIAWLGGGLAAIGAIRVKDTGALAKKFVRNASGASGDYTDGVKAAGGDWETNTKASEDNYKLGVTQAANDGRFGRGVAKAGAGKYTQRASTLGAQRYPTGVAAAEGDWAQGAQPYLQAIANMTLPPRRPKGDPGNQARANAVAAALRAMKVGK
jgi:hypothetical protein